MLISDLCIKRPVFATVLSITVVLLGVISYQRLTVREYPQIDEPAVQVTTTYDGASAQIIETQVTKILEDSIAGIEGVKLMTSISREETSVINISFVLSRDPDNAAAEVRDRVARVRQRLPDDVDEPIVAKVQADAQPIYWLVMRSDRHSPAQITEIADRYVQDALQTIPGVADVEIFGERRYAMRVWLDVLRLASFGLTPQDVEAALRAQNLEVPGGRVESAQREFTVLTRTDINSVAQFNELVVANRDGHLVRLRDVGRVALGVESDRVAFRMNGDVAVGLGVVKQAVANPLEISQAIRARMPELRRLLPDGMTLDDRDTYDSSQFIEKSIANVQSTLIEAVLLVLAVILLFLRSFRATLVPLVTIPVSLIGTCSIMLAMGFSINTLTLLAMVLAIGLVVDDAIVVLENIHRHVEEGMHPIRAAFVGSREIAFAVIAMTITLAAVYVPIGFMEGRTGKLFTEFALTLAAAVLISGFVALTLSPMMCSLLLKHEPHPALPARVLGRLLSALDAGYRRALEAVLANRIAVLPVLALVGIGIVVVFQQLRSELAPLEDRGALFTVMIGPEGATVDYMTAYAKMTEAVIGQVPEAEVTGLVVGIGGSLLPVASQGLGFIKLTDWSKRQRHAIAIAQALGPPMFMNPGYLNFPITPGSLGSNPFAKPIEFVVKDSRDYHTIAGDVDRLMAVLRQNPGLVGLESDLKLNTPQLRVDIDRDLAGDLGVEVAAIGRALETMLAGRQVTRFKRGAEQYDVIVQINENERRDPDQLNRIFVRGHDNALVPLGAMVSLSEGVAPQDLNHFDRWRSVKITANLAPGYSQGEALAFVRAAAAETFPPGTQFDYDGQSREFMESSAGLYVTFGLALLFIFLVLAAQFESFIDPFIILITVPLSILGALFALQATGHTLNVYSQIGLVTLIGLISKHGILICEFANQIQETGRSKREAVTMASVLRLRPILMTTGAMVLGSLPLAIATGAGAESRQAIGWVIVGGLSVGTLLTLFVVPVVYSVVAADRSKRVRREDYLPEAAPAAPAAGLPPSPEGA
ncbi:MAG: efflux RND transporter permease subunit [Thalassobaculales bacterium]